MVETALESGDALLRQGTDRLLHVEVPIDPSIRSLDFSVRAEVRRNLYREGHRCALSFFVRRFGSMTASFHEPVGILEAVYGDRNVFQTALGACAQAISSRFRQSGTVRAYVMLPYDNGSRSVVVYQSGMDDDPDIDLNLLRGAGPGGDAVQAQRPIITDWAHIRERPETSSMTRAQINKVPFTRRSVASAPVFDLRRDTTIENGVLGVARIMGSLSVDSDRSAVDAGWANHENAPDVEFIQLVTKWADVIGRLLN